jgi:hypothetical protein
MEGKLTGKRNLRMTKCIETRRKSREKQLRKNLDIVLDPEVFRPLGSASQKHNGRIRTLPPSGK